MNFEFDTCLSSLTERFELLSFPKVIDILRDLCNFTAILDVPSCLLFCLPCQNDMQMSMDFYNLISFALENRAVFVQIYTIFIKMLELFKDIRLLNSILYDFSSALGFAVSLTQYFLSHIHQTHCTQRSLALSLTRSPISCTTTDKQTILLSKHFQNLLNFPISKVTELLYNLIELYCYQFTIQLEYSISLCILYDEEFVSKVDFFLAQKGTNDLFIDIFRPIIANICLHICKLMKNPIIHFDNAGSLISIPSSQFRITSQSFQAISSSLRVSHKINLVMNCFFFKMHYFREHLPDYLDRRLKLFSCIPSPCNTSLSQIEVDLQTVFSGNITKNYVDYGHLNIINQSSCNCMLIIYQTFQRYLELVHQNALLYNYLVNYAEVYLHSLIGIHSIIPSESNYSINTRLFSTSFFSKIFIVGIFKVSEQIIDFWLALDYLIPLCYTFFYFQTGYSVFFLFLTIIVQEKFEEETSSNCSHFSRFNFILPFRKYLIFQPICDLSFISNVIRDCFDYGLRSCKKCSLLNYDIHVNESPDGLVFNLNI